MMKVYRTETVFPFSAHKMNAALFMHGSQARTHAVEGRAVRVMEKHREDRESLTCITYSY